MDIAIRRRVIEVIGGKWLGRSDQWSPIDDQRLSALIVLEASALPRPKKQKVFILILNEFLYADNLKRKGCALVASDPNASSCSREIASFFLARAVDKKLDFSLSSQNTRLKGRYCHSRFKKQVWKKKILVFVSRVKERNPRSRLESWNWLLVGHCVASEISLLGNQLDD